MKFYRLFLTAGQKDEVKSIVMIGLFFKLSSGVPAVRDIRSRSTRDGRNIPPLWVRYEVPLRVKPHDRSEVRAGLIHFGASGVRQVRHRSGAVYTFSPWVPARRILRQGERTPLLRVPGPGLSGFEQDKTSRIKAFGLSEALQYSYMRDHRFAIYTSLVLFFSLWIMFVPQPLALKPEVLSSVDLGLIVKVAQDTFIEGVCSNHPHIGSPCDCGEPLNTTLKSFLDVEELFDQQGNYKREKVLSAVYLYMGIITLFIALYESGSANGVLVDTSSWF